MQDNKEHFLDSKTLIAIILLVVCWLGWDHYMKKKYPVSQKENISKPLAEKTKQEEEREKPPLNFSSEERREHKEEDFEFHGENMEIVFSSKGFGVKQLKLKKYHNRQKESVVFYSPEKPLFSSFFFKSSEDFIPFKIEKKGNLFTGVFSFSQGTIRKTVEIDDERFVLNSKMRIEPAKGKTIKGLSLAFSHPLPKQGKEPGFLKMFLIYGREVLKAFVFYDGKQNKRLTVEDIKESTSYANLKVAALGGKYFGKAFINDTSFFPSVNFVKNEDRVQARVDYKFLHSKTQEIRYTAFLGPKSLKSFQKLGVEVREWLDFGFFGWLARPLLLFLNWLYGWCHNWGWAIVLLTFFVRLCLLPINIKSYKSMKVMQKIQPRIKELKEKYKSDPKKMNLEVMSLMKQNKANPLGGCLPLFIQFPVFFALYRVLGESIELYQSPFIFWIKDLSLKDPYYLLPVLGGLVLFVQQRLTPMNLPKEQARLLTAMPLLFSVFMLSLPSGLTLYIFVSGLFGLIQQFFFVKLGQSQS